MSISKTNRPSVALTFEAIDEHLQEMVETQVAMATTPADRKQRFIAAYITVRPILEALGLLPLLPTNWRVAVRAFLMTIDEIVAPRVGALDNPDFKAGKDL